MKTTIAYLLLAAYLIPISYKLIQLVILIVKEKKKGKSLQLKKIFKYGFILIVPTIIGFSIISHTNYFDYEKPKPYDSIHKITFKNFRGIELLKKSLYGNKRFAYIVTSIESEIDDDSVTVISYFHPSRSFVYSKQSNSKELLKHELYHFKITELYTRLIKQRIKEMKTNSKDSIKKVLLIAKQIEREYQKQYDYDTFHSYVYSEQKKYEREIDSVLIQLVEFKKPKISLKQHR